MVVSNLFPCERKVTVMHSEVNRCNFGDRVQGAIRGKEEVMLHCGFRRFPAKPIYSRIPTKSMGKNDKYKLERYFQPGAMCMASWYGPAIFPPCPVLVFADSSPQNANPQAGEPSTMEVGVNAEPKELVAWGRVKDGEPQKMVVKRVVLTGYPYRVHKSKAVARYMFFDPADIRWFKPVELRTKNGLRGHVKESLGTHGYMKCQFNGWVKQDDVICLHLYKRAFPKWYPPTWGGQPEERPDEIVEEDHQAQPGASSSNK